MIETLVSHAAAFLPVLLFLGALAMMDSYKLVPRRRIFIAIAAGTVAATATLAQIFPPATVLVLLGDQLGNAYQAAQLAQGNFSPRSVNVGDLFAGALIPGFALVGMYLVFLMAVAILRPKACPALLPDPNAPRGLALARRLIEVLIAPLLLILTVLGSILGGVATPTEAASIGAVGSILLAARKAGLRGVLSPWWRRPRRSPL